MIIKMIAILLLGYSVPKYRATQYWTGPGWAGRLEAGSQKPKTGSRKPEAGSQKLELEARTGSQNRKLELEAGTGSWNRKPELEAGSWKLEAGNSVSHNLSNIHRISGVALETF